MIVRFLLCFLFLHCFYSYAFTRVQNVDSLVLEHSVFLLGNMGAGVSCEDNLLMLKKHIKKTSGGKSVVFLGNSVLKSNYELVDINEKNPSLKNSLQIIKQFDAKSFFIPGNNEWNNGTGNTFLSLGNIKQNIDSCLGNQAFYLSNACPGPQEIKLSNNIVLILLDSQWWLNTNNNEVNSCGFEQTSDFITLLQDIIERNKGKHIVVAAHHPMYSTGETGGNFKFLGPLQIYKKLIGNSQSFSFPLYRSMRKKSKEVFKYQDNLISVGAHDKSLQYIKKDSVHYVVSGSISDISYVDPLKADFALSKIGYSVIRFYSNGCAYLEFWAKNKSLLWSRVYRNILYKRNVCENAFHHYSYNKDSIAFVPASNRYLTKSSFKEMFLGSNYRNEWSTKLNIEFFDFNNNDNVFTPMKRGGGQQTRSLRLQDTCGKQYVLRSIEKYTSLAIPEMLHNTLAADIVQDGISASYPYAALAVAPLAKAIGLYHTNPRLVYIDKNDVLGIYNRDIKKGIYLFEERPKGDMSDYDNFGNSTKIYSTNKMLRKLLSNSKNRVDENSVLKARLLDLLINDWDRHDDQWRWASFKKNGETIFKPIPRDRDQAFFFNNGVLPWLARRKWIMRKFQIFDSIAQDVVGLGFNSRFFDRSFLNSLDRKDWKQMSVNIKSLLTDNVIHNAIAALPEDLPKQGIVEIERKLKSRRNNLSQMADEFYSFLCKQVDIVATNKKDYVHIEILPQGNVDLSIYAINKNGSRGKQYFNRHFVSNETKEIRIYAMAGNDSCVVSGNAVNKIKIRYIGGLGNDFVDIKSSLVNKKLFIYDDYNTQIKAKAKYKSRLNNKEEINSYDRKAFKYNMMNPDIFVDYVNGDGLVVGVGASFVNQAFRKKPFANRHKISAKYSFLYPSVELDYKGKYVSVFQNTDLLIQGLWSSPNTQSYFFGYGAQTKKQYDISFYRIRYSKLHFSLALSHNINKYNKLSLCIDYEGIKMNKSENSYLLKHYYVLNNDLSFNKSAYLSLGVDYSIDTRNNTILPTEGMFWHSTFSLNKDFSDKDYYHFSTDFSVFLNFGRPYRSILALRGAYAHNSSTYAFYRANKLGDKSNLRGYKQDRFSGDNIIYANIDYRLRLWHLNSYLFGGDVGILAFTDIAKVYMNDNYSRKWFHSYGMGLWLSPFNLFVFNINYAVSKENNLFKFQFKYFF